jgi:hypothetical protein
MLDHLIFDTTNATTDADTHSVGAYVRSGKSSALITHHALFKLPASPFSFVDADVTPASDLINEVAHGFRTNDLVRLTSTGVLPAGLALATDYYVIRVDADNIKLASTQFNAEWGIAVDITAAAGGGTHTVTGQTQDVRALDVFANLADGEGNKITSTGTSLNVNMTNSPTFAVDIDGIYTLVTNLNPDNAGIIAHTRAVALTDVEQIERTTSALAGLDGVAANTFHGLDTNSAIVALNAGGTLDSIKSTTNALWVNIQNASIAVTQSTSPWVVSDAALANTAAGLVATAETGAAANISKDAVAAPLANRKYLWLYNNDNQKMFIGGAGVTPTSGFPISSGSYMELRAGAAVDVEFVSAKASHLIRTLELS